MKHLIYYFSGTGNNLAIAKQLQQELDDTTILPISTLMLNKQILLEYDWVGFCVPSYYSHIPPYVKECMKDVRFTNQQKIFTIIGCAGNRGLAVQDMRSVIEKCNKNVQLEYMIMLPGSYIFGYSAFPNWLQQLEFRVSHHKIHHIAKDINKNRKKKPMNEGLFYKKKEEPRLQKAILDYSKIGLSYQTNHNCVSCGICAKVCPVGNIELKDKKVVFGSRCNQCMACVQWCPNHAIDYQQKAHNRSRYHHKEIKLQEMFLR